MNQEEMIQETHDTVIELNTVLCGAKDSDDKGLIGEVKDVKVSLYKLKLNFWKLVYILIGLGILGGGAYGLFNGG